MEEGCICVTLKNSNNDVIYVDFESEFTHSYAGWHTHYSPYSGEHEILKADLLSILNNDKCSFVIECKDKWMGGQFLLKKIFRKKMQLSKSKNITSSRISKGTQGKRCDCSLLFLGYIINIYARLSTINCSISEDITNEQ